MTKVIRDTRERVQKGDLLADHMMASLVQLAKKTEAAEQDEAIKRFSVIPRISAEQTIPPTLIAQGDADLIVEAWNAEMLYEKLTEAKKEVAYYLLTGARHGDKRFFDTEMIDRYEAFIRKHCR